MISLDNNIQAHNIAGFLWFEIYKNLEGSNAKNLTIGLKTGCTKSGQKF